MVVSFSVGSPEKNRKIINTLKKQADNINFYSYNTIQELVKEASTRHLEFKRIIFSTAILKDTEKDLNELNDFIKNYSTSTEVVMILSAPGEDKVFNSIFNSPMYTPVILPKATAKNVLDLVRSDIMELKAKYYILDKDISKENSSVNEETNSEESNTSEEVSEVEEKENIVSSGFASGPASVDINEGIFNQKDDNLVEEASVENTSNFRESPSLPEDSNFNQSDSENEEEISLSIGSFGSSHSDTGYLDEEEDQELQAYLNKKNADNRNISLENRNYTQFSGPVSVENRNIKIERGNAKLSNLPNIDLILSTRDSRATQSIVDQAVEIYSKDSARVLIIDLDVKYNSILSYIDTAKFYRESAYEGITKQRIYEEDGVSIVSNGYGVPLTTRELTSFLDGRLPREFDMIYIDCPTDCMQVLTLDLLQLVNTIIFTKGDRSNLIYTSLALTNRKVVALEVEKWVMNNCLVDIEGECSQEDLDFINSSMLFANGNWLQRKDI